MAHSVKPALFVAAAYIASWQAALAQLPPTSASKSPQPRITFRENEFDFGNVKSSDVLVHEFAVTNSGDTVLELKSVTPACGCTVAGTWERLIQPGRTGKIPIQFTPANFDGTVAKSITITSNDPAQPTYTLQIRATVRRPIDVQPASVYFTPLEGEPASITRVVRINSNLDQPLTLERPTVSHPAFESQIKTLKPGKEFELHVTYRGIVANASSQAVIEIATSSTEIPKLNLIATLLPQPAVSVIPSQIKLSKDQVVTGFQHNQVVLNSRREPMKVTNAAVNIDGVTVDIKETRPGKLFNVTVQFPPNFQDSTDRHPRLTIHTSDERHPVITIPIQIASIAPAEGSTSQSERR